MNDSDDRRKLKDGSVVVQWVFRALTGLVTAVILATVPAFFELKERVSLLQADVNRQNEIKGEIKSSMDGLKTEMRDSLSQESRRWEALRSELLEKMEKVQQGQVEAARYRERAR